MFEIHPNIELAETPPSEFYISEHYFQVVKERVFEQSWHFIGDYSMIDQTNVVPVKILDHFLDERLLLTKDNDENLHCISNVCTHRGNVMIQHPCKAKKIVCNYHGRRFDLNGDFEFMPEFKEVQNFPRNCDHLKKFDVKRWGDFLFVGMNPNFSIDHVFEIMNERLYFLPLQEFKRDATSSRDYIVNANWALYCDNYLEGFHIPFVHPDLNAALDYNKYKTIMGDNYSLQIGYGDSGSEGFELPEGHPDFGEHITAYYYWIFPNMMFNFYPWGLSINIVKPITKEKTRVSFITYVYDESKMTNYSIALIDKVEREDEFVVENVQRGLHSKYYNRGRYSATKEKGVHHFHRLLVEKLK